MDNVAIRFPTGTHLPPKLLLMKIEVADVGRVIRDLANLYLTNPKIYKFPEILHFSASEKMTKYDMALKFAEILGVPTDHLVKMDTIDEAAAVSRPRDCQLDVGRLKELGVNVLTVDFESWWKRQLGTFRH
jgi:S-adenosylmethionine synthetase